MSSIPKDVALRALSGADTSGLSMVNIDGTSSGTADTIHTAVAGTSDADYVTLWALNYDGSANYNLTLVADTEVMGPFQINRLQAPIKILDRYRMNNTLVLKGYAGTTDVIRVFGTVSRVTEAGS